MRKCCICINLQIGATILGVLALIVCSLELVALIPYLMQIDVEVFNPIQKNVDDVVYVLEKMLEEHEFTQEQIQEIVENIRGYMSPVFLGATVEAGVYGICSLMMIVGVQCRVRALMIPYLVLQMLCVIILMIVAIGVTIGLFFLNVIMGVVAAVVVLIISFLLIYFWSAIQRAYVELGNNDYMYSPAPMKPNDGYYPPHAPQHFQMDERR